MGNPMNELWQAQQNAATRMAESWRGLLQPAAERTARPPAPSETVDRPQEPADTGQGTAAHDVDEIVEPEPESDPAPTAWEAMQAIQALGEGQREFAGQMARWAELQRELADTLSTWARRQQDYADALDRALAPFVPGTDGRSA